MPVSPFSARSTSNQFTHMLLSELVRVVVTQGLAVALDDLVGAEVTMVRPMSIPAAKCEKQIRAQPAARSLRSGSGA